MAQPKLIAGISGKLHGVLEQAWTRRETRAWKAPGARIILLHRAHDGLIVGARRFGDHVELIARREFDVAVRIVEELGEFGFDRLYDNKLRRNPPENFACLFFGSHGCRADDLRHLAQFLDAITLHHALWTECNAIPAAQPSEVVMQPIRGSGINR